MKFNVWESFFGDQDPIDQRFVQQFDRLYPHANQMWGVKEAVWIDTNDAWKLFLEIPELRAVLDKRASMMKSNIPYLCDSNGDVVENHWLLDLIQNPNPTQSWSDVVYSMAIQDGLYSNVFNYCPKRSFDIRNLFVPLPSNHIEINLSGKKLKQMGKDGLIDYYNFMYDDQKWERIEVEDMIYITTQDGMNLVKPHSRIESLKYPLSNLKAQYHKRNVLLENLGAIGILSAQQNDMGGSIPMTPEERAQIQKDWYKRSKDELVITESNVNWQPMSYPTRDLMLFEEQTADKLALIDAYGLNYNIFSTEKGSTFSNVRDSIKMVYTDTIIPETQAMYDSIIQQLGLDEEGYHLKADFSHLAIMQSDREKEAATLKVNAEALEKIQLLGITLSEEEQKQILNIENLK